ncbi:PH domain-containing protein [Apilactobacillus kunkeei]|nr:PH domain-containing protein [Apilactobacillus kunkeei]
MDAKKIDELIATSTNPEKMGIIVDQLHACGFGDAFMTGRELKQLPDLIQDDETIKFATSGNYDATASSVLIVVTDKRVLLENKKLFFGSQNTEIPLTQINDISYNSGMMFASLTLISGSKEHKMSIIEKKYIEKLVQTIRVETENAKKREHQDSSDNNSSNGNIDDEIAQLKKLKSLVDEGIITDEEFAAKKKKVLGI